jgi:hypothetical protein
MPLPGLSGGSGCGPRLLEPGAGLSGGSGWGLKAFSFMDLLIFGATICCAPALDRVPEDRAWPTPLNARDTAIRTTKAHTFFCIVIFFIGLPSLSMSFCLYVPEEKETVQSQDGFFCMSFSGSKKTRP